ncbi:unnamed protein product, partial [Iphiclides podalirius]
MNNTIKNTAVIVPYNDLVTKILIIFLMGSQLQQRTGLRVEGRVGYPRGLGDGALKAEGGDQHASRPAVVDTARGRALQGRTAENCGVPPNSLYSTSTVNALAKTMTLTRTRQEHTNGLPTAASHF